MAILRRTGKLDRVLLAATLAWAGAPASASSANFGYVTAIFGASNGAVLFTTSGARDSQPACQAPGLAGRFALDGSTVAGQAQIAVLLNAYNLHKRIYISGKGACTIWGDTETVDWFNVED